MKSIKRKIPRNSIKEAFDNLPSGVCFFNRKGILILCNKQMYNICFALAIRNLQIITDLENALSMPPLDTKVKKVGDSYFFPDGSVWRIASKVIGREERYTEFIASNVTELYEKQRVLKQSTIEREQMGERMRQISKNVEAITREEEILTMKMLIHNKVGEALQRLRHYHKSGSSIEEKEEIIKLYDNLVHVLMGEIGNNDDIDDLNELLRVSKTLGVEVIINGTFPREDRIRNVAIMSLRECMTNTIRHAKGSRVILDIHEDKDYFTFKFTNNGQKPTADITEGGGLTSLRRRIEMSGGMMKTESKDGFKLIVSIPKSRRERL